MTDVTDWFALPAYHLTRLKEEAYMHLPGPMELLLIFLVVLLLFGAKKIPEIARGLGQGIREFKKTFSEITKD